MDIRNVASNGSAERAGDRGKRAEAQRVVLIPTVDRDQASISSASREAAAAVEVLAERARGGDREREAVVARAKAKLAAGELDAEPALTATAQRLLDANFLAG